MIVAFSRAVDGALERHRMRKPPLGGRTDVEGRARNAEDLRRDVVVGPEEAPHPAISGACSIRRTDKKAPDDDVLEGVGGGCGEFKIEVIERVAVAIAWLPGQPIGSNATKKLASRTLACRASLTVLSCQICRHVDPIVCYTSNSDVVASCLSADIHSSLPITPAPT